jgi:hypothetical protein
MSRLRDEAVPPGATPGFPFVVNASDRKIREARRSPADFHLAAATFHW